jgi:hypothetical protein
MRTNFAAQTPVYDEAFLQDWKPLDSAYMGKHLTETWKQGSGDSHISDRIEIGQPNLQTPWQTISATECGASPCDPPRTYVGFGTTRTSHNMEQRQLNSQLFCMTQLRYNTRPSEQIAMIMKGLKKVPEMYTSDYLRVKAFSQAPSVQVAQSTPATFTPSTTNTAGQLTTIDLGSAGALPTSQLSFPYLNYITTTLGLNGYTDAGSGLPTGMYNLITSDRAWYKLTNGADSMKDMMALDNPDQASPLFKIGQGIQKPFGNIAPSLDTRPIRFQLMTGGSGGLLNRVQEYINVAGTTGIKRQVNPAWVNARYELGFIWHPKAIKMFTPEFKKMHDKVPTVNTAMFGEWQFINNQGAMIYVSPDGTSCTKDNALQNWFYWICRLELGFQYLYPELMTPILYLVDGSGLNSIVADPVCGTAPTYSAQNYSDNPTVCAA